MKLLLCRSCEDIVRVLSDWRACRCGSSRARYVDNTNAQYTGEHAAMIGVQNGSIADALREHASGSPKREFFTAFVIPNSSQTSIRV